MVDVAHEHLPTILGRETVASVHDDSPVSPAASTTVVPDMAMVPHLLNVPVDVRAEVTPGHPSIAGPLHDMEEMPDVARRHEYLAVLVEADSPGIVRPPREYLEALLDRMVTPHAGIDGDAFLRRIPGPADKRTRGNAINHRANRPGPIRSC